MRHLRLPALPLLLLALLAPAASAQTKLLRYPDLHGETVVFCYAGDLWSAPIPVDGKTATARRLTSHPGLELFPKLSPDGRQVAFTAQYEGDEQVYVVPVEGGMPRRLTWYPAGGPFAVRWGYDHHVYGWSPDGSAVLFRSLRDSHSVAEPRLYTVPVEGGLPTALPMPVAGSGSFSPDGSRIVYSPLFRDFRSWKRYEGGWAQDLYVFDLQSHETRRITEHPRSDRDAMWIGETIVFSSDRDDKLNLYRHDLASGETTQLTRHADWDVRWPESDGADRVVYELGGELWIHDLSAGSSRPIPILVPDEGIQRRSERIAAGHAVESYELSPDGKRALLVARGDVFSVPVDEGRTRNLTASSAHDREAVWSPEGDWIAYVSDAGGEEEIWRVRPDGRSQPEKLVGNDAGRLYDLRWSPDGASIAFCDKDGRLKVLDVEERAVSLVHDEIYGRIGDHAWSPGGEFLAFSASDDSGLSALYLWEREEERTRRVTGELSDENAPVWDPDGDYLFFLADHSFAPQIGAREWNFVLDRETGIYALALRTDVEHPFPIEDGGENGDEEEEKEEEDEGEDGDDGDEEAGEGEEEEEDEEEPVRIDFDGLAGRVARVPVDFDNYGSLAATSTHLLFTRGGPFYYGRSSDVETALVAFSLEDEEEKEVSAGISGWALSADGKKVLVRSGGTFQVLPSEGGDAETVSTGGLFVDRVPAQEWRVIFDEVWRRFRDYFYVENMHGYDWESLRELYVPLLEHVSHRSDLNYVIAEMIAELSVSHAYVAGGDERLPTRVPVALPGARFEVDPDAGRLRIASILSGDNTEPTYRSPLTEVGRSVAAGEYVLAINGRELLAGDNPYRLLQNPSGEPVELLVNGRPERDGARAVLFEGLADESDLVYHAWVEGNRRRVAKATGGRVGYLHLPDMGSRGISEFIRQYYGQVRKEGLVVDVRGNGGGNVSQMVIERLGRRLLGLDYARGDALPTTYPSVVFHGHMVCLLNEHSASDGDIFPWTFRRAGIGPLIGKRSWGGIIGITNHGPLIDGGSVFVPQYGNASDEGQWVIEGHGVEPDIEVENDPGALLAGRDDQLERGIQEVLARIEADPRRLPSAPAPPVKTY